MKQKHYARLTVDMTPEEHTYLKMASAQLGVSMREFILKAAFKQMGQTDDQWLVEKAEESLKRIESWKEKPKKLD